MPQVFPIITLIHLGHNCLFRKVFCTVYFRAKEKNAVTLPYSAQSKHSFLGKIKDMSKTKQLPSRKKIYRIIVSKIRTQIYQVIVSWGY